jgi:MFS family permease
MSDLSPSGPFTDALSDGPSIRQSFRMLWLAMLLNMTAGNFLLVALSLRTYAETGSVTAASLFFVAQFAAPVLFARLTEHLCRRMAPRRAMILADTISLLAMLGIAATGGTALWAIFVLLIARGFGDSLLKSARAIAIKSIFPPETLARNNALLTAPHFIGNGIGVLLASALVERVAFGVLGLVGAALVAGAVLAYLAMRGAETPPERQGRKTNLRGRIAEAFVGNAALRLAAVQASAAVIFLQGIHQITRTAVPMQRYGLDASQAGLFQLASITGILTATVLVAQIRWVRERLAPSAALICSAAALVAVWLMPSPLVAAVVYFLFMCSFEIGFVRAQNDVMAHATPEALATVMALLHFVGFSGMALLILAGGALADLGGGLLPSSLVAAAVLAISLAAPRLTGATSR